MKSRKNPILILQQKSQLVRSAIQGRASASASSLSASFGLPIEDIRQILREAKVNDDG